MFLRSLSLHNFSNIEKAELQFRQGINLIQGGNGSGKSSLLRAISFILLGHTEKSIEDYLNWKKDRFILDLAFSHNNQPYSFNIDFDRAKKSTTKLLTKEKESAFKGREELFKGQDSLTHLSSLYDFSLCKTSVFSLQGELDMIYATPAERRDILKRVYDLDFIQQIKEIDLELAKLSGGKQELEKEQYRLKSLTYDLEEVPVLPFSEEMCKTKRAELESMRQTYASMVAQQEKVSASEMECFRLNREIPLQEQKLLKEQGDKDADDVALGLLDKEEATKREEVVASIGTLQATLDGLVGSRIPLYEMEKHLNLQVTLRGLESELARVKAGKCPTCGREYDDRTTEGVLEKDVQTYKGQLQEMEQTALAYKSATARNTEVEAQRLKLTQQINALMSTRDTISADYANKRKTISFHASTCQANIAQLSTQLLELRARLVEHEAVVEQNRETRFKEQLVNLSLAINTAEAIIQAYAVAVGRKADIEARNAMLAQAKVENDKKLIDTETSLTEFDEAISTEGTVKEILKKDYPNFVIARLISSIESATNDFLARTYEGKYRIKIQETKSGLEIVYGDRDKPVILASGSEKSLINLGIKIGFARLSGLGLLLLDEVDSYMSNDIAEEVFEVIKEMLDEGHLTQAFIISHKEDIKEQFLQMGARVIEMKDGEVANVYG